MRDTAKNNSVGVGREDSALRGFAEGSAELVRLEHAYDGAFSDPAFYPFYPKHPDPGSGEAR